jgi:hypothetical protein
MDALVVINDEFSNPHPVLEICRRFDERPVSSRSRPIDRAINGSP